MVVPTMPTIKQLQCFRSIAASQNMSETALQTGVSQTALSNSIARLEDELGVKLFDRVGKKLVLNEYGTAYLKYVNIALEALQNGQTFVNSIKLSNSNMNTVSLYSNSALFLTQPINDFQKAHPEITVYQSEVGISQMRESLVTVSNSLIITGESDLQSNSLEHEVLYPDRTVLFVPKNHHLASRYSVSLSDLKDEVFIMVPPWLGFHEHCERIFARAGFTPNVLCECDVPMRKFFLSRGEGIMLASPTVIQSGLFNDVAVPVFLTDEYVRRNLSVFWAKHHVLTPSELVFIEWLKTFFDKLDFPT